MQFKILQGPSEHIGLDVTPFSEGWSYFTYDDGGLYIDAIVNGENRRIRVVSPASDCSISATATLTADGWTNGEQTLSIAELPADADGVAGLAQTATEAQVESAAEAVLRVTSQSAGSLTITALGTVPTCDIPVEVFWVV